ncbi:hypothetical protein [Sphingomonas fennica]|uniref:DUF1282 domain-containing protein n=1 Tax=Edaphosphingomonas fennica TaxID=114404 RepID=A0A2T4HYP6_9SPHN|nr:hypothetical protein [Sphingomonas fennica]PTD21202.1 hypothetical protein CV103_11050 [Sphingomonas fennica]
MNFVQWLNSLDELLYELMSWFVFFPVTLWKVLRHPLAMMRYAEDQLKLDDDRQYRGTVSPPIMLVLTIVAEQAIGLAEDGTNPIVKSQHGLASLVNDNTTLLLLHLVLFGTFALVLATGKVYRSSVDLDRDTLKPAFYAQCYAISPFALLVSLGVSGAMHSHGAVQLGGLTAIVAAFLFYGIVQVRWFSRELNQSLIRSFVDASVGMVASIIVALFIGRLFV